MNLIIVESPHKSEVINRFLGKEYTVLASKGHIRDLASTGKMGLGVDIADNFKPTYFIPDDKKATVKELKAAVKKADTIYLATDPDREGEAIAWHLAQVLDLPVETTKRLDFEEITKSGITAALKTPRTIDMNLVKSQETRRIIDRIMGYRLSSLLQKKIKSRSAGRVQSVVLKLIVEKEKEIQAFKPEEYWTIDALLAA
jgi:DNA topoisomerase-1